MLSELAFAFMVGSVASVTPCGAAPLPAYRARRVASKIAGSRIWLPRSLLSRGAG